MREIRTADAVAGFPFSVMVLASVLIKALLFWVKRLIFSTGLVLSVDQKIVRKTRLYLIVSNVISTVI